MQSGVKKSFRHRQQTWCDTSVCQSHSLWQYKYLIQEYGWNRKKTRNFVHGGGNGVKYAQAMDAYPRASDIGLTKRKQRFWLPTTGSIRCYRLLNSISVCASRCTKTRVRENTCRLPTSSSPTSMALFTNAPILAPYILWSKNSEFSQNPPRILQNSWTDSKNLGESSKIIKISPNFKSILTIRGLLMAYITRISVCLRYMCY